MLFKICCEFGQTQIDTLICGAKLAATNDHSEKTNIDNKVNKTKKNTSICICRVQFKFDLRLGKSADLEPTNKEFLTKKCKD